MNMNECVAQCSLATQHRDMMLNPIDTQLELERKYNHNQLMPRLREEFRVMQAGLLQMDMPVDFSLDLLAQMAVRKRADFPTLYGLLRHHKGDITNLLAAAIELELVNWDIERQQFVTQFGISEELQDELNLYQFPLPMVVEPEQVEDNTQTGYLTCKGSILLNGCFHREDVCLDHINRANKLAWRINTHVVNQIQNQWKHLDKPMAGEGWAEFQKRRKAFEKYTRDSQRVMQEMIDCGNQFWFTHRYDKRGRTYAMGYHMSPQGNDWNKAVLEFANMELPSEHGLEVLTMDIAGSFGLDKKSWTERMVWFNQHESVLDQVAIEAKDPARFVAGVDALRRARRDQPSGYPVALDATSSGIQILAVLTGDRKAAELCNVVDAGGCMDAYSEIHSRMPKTNRTYERPDLKRAVMTSAYGSRKVPETVFGADVDVFYETMGREMPGVWELQEFLLDAWDPTAESYNWVLPDNFHVQCKIMDRVSEQVEFMGDTYTTFHYVNQPKESGKSLSANLTHSVDGMLVREMLRRCNYDQVQLLKVCEVLIKGKGYINQRVLTEDDKMVLTLWQRYQESGFLSARILDHLDYSNVGWVDTSVIWGLVNSLPSEPFELASIHDCFRVLPNHADDVRAQYNNLLKELAKSQCLQTILEQMFHKAIPVTKLDPDLWQAVGTSAYSLC